METHDLADLHRLLRFRPTDDVTVPLEVTVSRHQVSARRNDQPTDTPMTWIPICGDAGNEYDPVPGEYYTWTTLDDDFWPLRPAAGVQPVRIQPSDRHGISFAYCLALSLYQNAARGLVPVSDTDPGAVALQQRCDSVTFRRQYGNAHHYPVSDLPQTQRATGEITAHCRLDDQVIHLLLSLLTHGRPYMETVIVTESLRKIDNAAQLLGQHLWQARHYRSEPTDDTDDDEYRDYLHT